MVEATGKNLPEEPEVLLWDLYIWTAFLKSSPHHYAKYTVGSVIETLSFCCLSNTSFLKMLLSLFFPQDHQLQLFQSIVLTEYCDEQMPRWGGGEGRTFQIFLS